MVKNLTQQMIIKRLAAAGFDGEFDVAALSGYIDLLIKWNRKINLTSLDVDPITESAIDRLIVEPVLAAALLDENGISIIDLGTGGGSPAIPFRIQQPSSSMRMVESRSRKCAFLREAIRHIGLNSTSVEESRFELLKNQVHLKSSAELITLRAVRLDDELVELICWLLVPGGRVFRFANKNDTAMPTGLRIDSSHALIPLLDSELQILSFVD
ncbi:MAG: RsmG family class I SAM-dependent methyltransferase [Acidobacteriota bacterium]